MNKTLLFLLFLCSFSYSQVAIGTTTPSPSSILQLESTTKAFVPPRMTDLQMNTIPTPLNGSIVFNETYDAMYVKNSSGWRNFFETSNASIILNKEFTPSNNAIGTTDNTYFNFPVSTTEVINIDSNIYDVLGNGRIRVKANGIYLVNASFSVINMPIGNRKFILAVFKNGALFGYLTRGVADLDVVDEWGASGSLCIPTLTNDVLDIRYVLNNSSVNLDARIINIGITKLK